MNRRKNMQYQCVLSHRYKNSYPIDTKLYKENAMIIFLNDNMEVMIQWQGILYEWTSFYAR